MHLWVCLQVTLGISPLSSWSWCFSVYASCKLCERILNNKPSMPIGLQSANKMQSETADYAFGEVNKTCRLWFWLITCIIWKHDIIHNPHNILQMSAMPSEEDRAEATGKTCRQFGEIWTCGFWDTRADRQTHWWQYFALLIKGVGLCYEQSIGLRLSGLKMHFVNLSSPFNTGFLHCKEFWAAGK